MTTISPPLPSPAAPTEPVSLTDEHESPPKSSLWQEYVKVYPRYVMGKFRRLKWAAVAVLLAIYYLAPWVRWDRGPDAPDQAILLDVTGRRLYFFFIELWPQEIYYLTAVLVMAAVGLFLATTLFGRLWCGYACPQTVWTDLYVWVERQIEGDRGQRIRLDKGPWTVGKVVKKLIKHSVWLLIALATGGVWIFYFNDAPTLANDLINGTASSVVLTFIGLFTATTYLLAGLAREQVCIYMCPWPRFQAAMQDEDSLIVTYQGWRGEQRGPVRKTVDWTQRAKGGFGDCVDCKMCQQVCPTGIDIRNGQQLACIGCGLCIDACNEVMTKVGRPRQLVTFDTQNAQFAKSQGQPVTYRLVRPRTIIYVLILIIVASLTITGLVLRPQLEVNVLRDRAPLYVRLSNGMLRNGFTVKLLNKTRETRDYVVTLAGLRDATFSVAGRTHSAEEVELHLTAPKDSVATYRIFVTVPRTSVTGESTPFSFIVNSVSDHETAIHDTVFRGPGS